MESKIEEMSAKIDQMSSKIEQIFEMLKEMQIKTPIQNKNESENW